MTDSWKPTACILCECNCGIEVELGGDDGRQFVRLKGDRSHPGSKGYVCQKAGRLNHYQNSRDRLLRPLRRRQDGSFEEVDWETAIREIAAGFQRVREAHGGASIFYYGGGGQGNHLPAGYAGATRQALGSVFRSNALAQEKTGEYWVNEQMFGPSTITRGDFEHCEVAVFLGKNPWQSHGIPRARVTLKQIAKDPQRTMIVVDPRRSETAEMADVHLQVRPGTDAWLLAAILGVMVEEDLVATDWLAEHTRNARDVLELLETVPVADHCEKCGVPEERVRTAARRMAGASSMAVFEDLGVQMNRHSTLVSWLNRLTWVLTGSFGRTGCQYIPSSMRPILASSRRGPQQSPVAGAPVIGGLTPCNLIADEILADHPARYRAMLVESANPAHSLADSARLRRALSALDFLVVIDVALTETARLAHWVLPTPTQYEKAEATFFNFDFPDNCFHLRRPLLAPPEGPLAEAEIHARLVEALGALPVELVAELRRALAAGGRPAFAMAFQRALGRHPELRGVAPVVLYRTLGETLPAGLESAAVLWAVAHNCAGRYGESIRRAGIVGDGPMLGESLFQAILDSPSGLVFTADQPQASWDRVTDDDGRIELAVAELFDELRGLAAEEPPGREAEFPFLLSAGERRSYTANTIYRDPAWRKKDREGALRMCAADAERLGLADGDRARLTTRRGTAEVAVAISERMRSGHVSLPNGLGLDYPDAEGERRAAGVAPNELTRSEDRDRIAGTPWHKSVPARIEPLAAG